MSWDDGFYWRSGMISANIPGHLKLTDRSVVAAGRFDRATRRPAKQGAHRRSLREQDLIPSTLCDVSTTVSSVPTRIVRVSRGHQHKED